MRSVAFQFSFAVFSLLLSACAEETTTSTSVPTVVGKTQPEKQLEKQVRSLDQVSNEIIVNNTVQGAAAGAALGCFAGFIFGDGAKDCVQGGLLGGGVGAVVGNEVGQEAAAKNVEIVKTKLVLANLSNVSKQLDMVEADLRSVLASQESELKSLGRQLDGGQLSQADYNKRVNAIKSNRQVVSDGLQRNEKKMDNAISDLGNASSKGQDDLGAARNAAVSTKDRLALARASINLL